MTTSAELGRGDLAAEIERQVRTFLALCPGARTASVTLSQEQWQAVLAALRPQPGPDAEEVALAILSRRLGSETAARHIAEGGTAIAWREAIAEGKAVQALYAPHLAPLSGDREKALEEARAAEREACAKVAVVDAEYCDSEANNSAGEAERRWRVCAATGRKIAKAIRSRSLTTATRGGDDA